MFPKLFRRFLCSSYMKHLEMPAASETSTRGALVVLEGCDKSGKTTQCKMLKETLLKNGFPVDLFRFPDRTTAIGKVISDYLSKKCELDDHAVHLLFSANRWELVGDIKKRLHEGRNVIIDRYAYSGVAFTAAKPGFTLDWCKQSDAGLPRPDLVLFLTLSSEEAAKRGGFGDERYEQTDFQKRVANNYDILKQENNWKVVDAGTDVETLHTNLTDIITNIIQYEKSDQLTKLWVEDSHASDPQSPNKKKSKQELLV